MKETETDPETKKTRFGLGFTNGQDSRRISWNRNQKKWKKTDRIEWNKRKEKD